MASIKRRPDGVYRARYRDDAGREHAKHFDLKRDAQRWLDDQTAALVTGMHVDPKTARTTVGDWCDTWLAGYGTRRPSTVRQARVHVAQVKAEFGPLPMSTVRPSHVKAWTAKLSEQGVAVSYVYALHARLAQIFSDAVHDGIVPRSPCSRRTSPPRAKQRPYVATTEQVWALHDAVPGHLRAAILLGAFAGLRVAEACGLRISDVDFMRGIITPAVQYPAQLLKTEISKTAIPIPRDLANTLSAHVAQWRPAGLPVTTDTLLADPIGAQLGPWALDRAVRSVREDVGLPAGFRYHDLRHFFSSLLIASGANVKVVQARLRHASATTTLDTYGHLWPDSDESTRTAVEAVLVARADHLRTQEVIN
jgi:integrase